jgi:hypothetical protein
MTLTLTFIFPLDLFYSGSRGCRTMLGVHDLDNVLDLVFNLDLDLDFNFFAWIYFTSVVEVDLDLYFPM